MNIGLIIHSIFWFSFAADRVLGSICADTKVIIKGVEKYVFNYKKANNATIIKEKTSSEVVTTTKQWFVVVTMKTEGDSVKINY